ncbi:heat-inducible transcription repressor hrcA [Bifidobacterium goeldii]|uniref:Heat-inducible transcription repressor HrcA n=1 Tax=Bifidobacterium goeldii TaxID=2306975 RepID=A0A430FLI6_9BIFI|nr:heat-inducible transcriptional repressor HrcA [Bifidobacterium goeldii]RSX53759.1 heat-inducible transcription repressor hrcA [Bifidobacterium goeldii]
MAQTRRMLVLRAIVEDYIRSQEPIGSTSLAKSHDLGVSSATIRNDMAALEDEGYLIQPHTSAGRIPTEKGYRYFVDRLSGVMPLSAAQKRGISTFLAGSVNLQDTLRRAARLLSQITGQVAVVASPSMAKATLRHVEIVPVSVAVLLIVVITDTGGVAQHTLAMSPQPSADLLSDLSNAVNAQCTGMTFAQAAERVRTMASTRSDGAGLLTGLADVLDAIGDDERASDLYMAGASRLAHQSDADDLAPLFDALEEQVVLMKLMTTLSQTTVAGGVGVAIGSETHTPGLLHASVVTSGYGKQADNSGSAEPTARADEQTTGELSETQSVAETTSAEPVAFVGSIGPTHMDYATTIAAVRAVARYLTESLSQQSGDGYTG